MTARGSTRPPPDTGPAFRVWRIVSTPSAGPSRFEALRVGERRYEARFPSPEPASATPGSAHCLHDLTHGLGGEEHLRMLGAQRVGIAADDLPGVAVRASRAVIVTRRVPDPAEHRAVLPACTRTPQLVGERDGGL